MATSRTESSRGESLGGVVYDAFISYSHAADGLLAPRLQSALQRFAKPWWQRRVLRLFVDESSLSANPHLWRSITDALDASRWFVLLLSPDAASSGWVNQEIEYWKAHKDPSRIVPVLTDGEFGWADGDVVGTAVPNQLRGVFSGEPRWVDLRFARDEEQLDLKDPRFADAVADVASSIRGVPKDELASEEVRQHRRTVRTAWAGLLAVGFLAIAALLFGIQARRERRRAEASASAEAAARRQAEANAELARARELAASAIGVVDSDAQLSILLALEALASLPEATEPGPELKRALREAIHSSSLIKVIDLDHTYSYLDVSPDDTKLAVSSGTTVTVFDQASLKPKWSYHEDTDVLFQMVAFSTEGRYLTVSVANENWFVAGHRQYPYPHGEPVTDRVTSDDARASVLVFDAATGDLVHRIELDEHACAGISPPGSLSDALGLLAVGVDSCSFWDGPHELLIYDIETWEISRRIPAFEGAHGVFAANSDSRFVIAMSGWAGKETRAEIFDVDSWDSRVLSTRHPFGTLSPDGSQLAAVSRPDWSVVDIIEVETGRVVDRLPVDGTPNLYAIRFASDGKALTVGTDGGRATTFSVESGRMLRSVLAGSAIGLAHSAKRLYTANTARELRVWDLTGAHRGEFQTVSPLPGRTNGVLKTNSTQWLWTITRDGTKAWIHMIDPDNGSLHGGIEDNWHLATLAGGRAVTWGHDPEAPDEPGPLQLVDLRTGSRSNIHGCWPAERSDDGLCPNGDRYEPGHLYMSTDGSEFALVKFKLEAKANSEIEIWDSRRLTPTDTFTLEDSGMTFIPGVGALTEDYFAAWNGLTSELVTFSRATGELIASTPGEWPYAITRDGATVFAADHAESTIVRADLPGLEPAAVFGPFPSRITGIAPSGDGKRLALVSGDEVVRVVDARTGDLLDLVPLDGPIDAAWIDDQHIGVGTRDFWTVVTLDLEQLTDLARKRLTRTFTDEERDFYGIGNTQL